MHELSLCRSIHTVVDGARNGRDVRVIHLRVGQLRQVVPETLEYCWTLVTESSPLAGSRLEIDHVPITLECSACGERSTIGDRLMLLCGACGSGQVAVLEGEEFLVTSIDVAPARRPDEPEGEPHGPLS